jgi:regulator of PEP synthase PpsR (kinase-PPPase family)
MVVTKPPPIYIVSGGVGASGEQLVYTVLAQFPESRVPVITVSHVRRPEQIEDVVTRAEATRGTIVHTLVDGPLRSYLVQLAQERGVVTIDLMGALMSRLAELLGREPAGHPGLYRQLHQDYFERVASIEFAMAHDDGRNPEGWPLADIVLIGVSRAGKTPLSMYLSVLGWKVANVPLVVGLAPPPELFQLDSRRVIGLAIEPGQLLGHRQQRQRHLGAPGPSAYTDPVAIYEEMEMARQVFKHGGFSTIDVTDKPIEASADEIIALITRRFGAEAHRR